MLSRLVHAVLAPLAVSSCARRAGAACGALDDAAPALAARAKTRRHAQLVTALLLACSAFVPARRTHGEEPRAGAGEAATDELAAKQHELSAQQARRAEVEHKRQPLAAIERELAEALHRDVRALYRLRQGGLLPLAGGLDALVGHASRVAQLERMMRRTLDKLDATRAESRALAKESVELDAKLTATEQRVRAIERERAQLAAAAAASAAAAQQASAMTERSERSHGERVSYGLTVVGSTEGESFAAQRGLLALPVHGAESVQPAEPMEGTRYKGLAFTTRAGASVRAAAAGRVSAVERAPNGVTVIVDHGERYRTVYRGLASSDVEVGDSVSKSARVGSAGSEPVHFEVHRGPRSQDARSFLGL